MAPSYGRPVVMESGKGASFSDLPPSYYNIWGAVSFILRYCWVKTVHYGSRVLRPRSSESVYCNYHFGQTASVRGLFE
jgi:hypothetical protein